MLGLTRARRNGINVRAFAHAHMHSSSCKSVRKATSACGGLGGSLHSSFRSYTHDQRRCYRTNTVYNSVNTKSEGKNIHDTVKLPSPPRLVEKINNAFINYPQESLVWGICGEIVTIYSSYTLLKLSGVVVPTDFALAFVLSRPLRRVRLPLELLAARGLAKAMPTLAQVRISLLYRAAMPWSPVPTTPDSTTSCTPTPTEAEQQSSSIGSNSSSIISSNPVTNSNKVMGAAKRAGQMVIDSIDSYGAAYIVGSRLVGISIIFSIYGSLHMGLDVQSTLHTYGFGDAERIGTVLGTWAAAVTMSSAFLPATLASTAYTAPIMAKARKSIFP
eukprot:CFRG0968T1